RWSHRRVGLAQELREICLLLRELVHGALARRFVGPPAQKFRSVAETVSGKMVVANLDHELRFQRLPLRRAAGGPSAWTVGRAAGDSRRRAESLEFQRERLLVGRRDRRGEAHVVQEAILAVEAEQERSDHGFALVIPETADHAVGAAIVFDLLHAGALARA